MNEENDAFRSLTRFYEAEQRYSATNRAEDRAALLATVHPEILLQQPASLPYGGEWRGREEFGRWLDLFMLTWAEVRPVDPIIYPSGDKTLISTVRLLAIVRTTGKSIDMPICQVITFEGGLPIVWTNFAWDTAAILEALKP